MDGKTEEVRSRLDAYRTKGDFEAFNQAVLVSAQHKVVWAELEKWAKKEGALEAFRELKKAYCKVAKEKGQA